MKKPDQKQQSLFVYGATQESQQSRMPTPPLSPATPPAFIKDSAYGCYCCTRCANWADGYVMESASVALPYCARHGAKL